MAIIDAMLGAEHFRLRQLFRVARSDDDMSCERSGDEQRRGRNAAAADNQKRFAGPQFGLSDQQAPQRDINQGKGGGFFERQAGGNGETIFTRHAHVFGVRSVLALTENGSGSAHVLLLACTEIALSAAE